MQRAPDIAELVGQGVAVVVATRDADLRPAVSRGWGPALAAGGAELTLCVDAPARSPTRANLDGGSPLAVTLSLPSSYATVQLKGRPTAVRTPTEAERARVGAHADAFAADTAALGLDPRLSRRLVGAELVTVVLAVEERYDQTPGPGAGGRL